ncbi:hypothetical protein ACIA5C_40150 [Actinoplanes sp. NPDC051343]|uniref:hypothetical protein n=1 Tax=Actinoplanes sp. NPDC051343 TaxID=3363906 RepID=UPI0037B73DDA
MPKHGGSPRIWRWLCAGLVAALPIGTAVVLHEPDSPRALGTFHDDSTVLIPAAQQNTAADLAVRLQAMLGQHSVLAADLMRSRIRGDDDFVQAANAALNKNTDDMSGLIGQLFGTPAAKSFSPLWSQHVVDLVTYAGALADHNDSARKSSDARLVVSENKLADFFSAASKGRLSKSDARSAVEMHVDHLTEQADAYAKKDYPAADKLYRAGFQHTYALGLALDDALLPKSDVAILQQPIWRLRSQLGELLAEHAVLIEDTTRAAASNTPDFSAAGDQMNGNTQDISAAIGTLFSASAGKQFQGMWASHVDALVSYGAATAAKDQTRQQAAKARLATFETQMSAFLAGATHNRLTKAQYAAALRDHDQMLMQHADAYAAKDYVKAHDVGYETYNHMFDLARTLADAFGESVAEKLPQGGAQTGYGGEAGLVATW